MARHAWLTAVLAAVALLATGAAGGSAGRGEIDGFRAVSGLEAAAFMLPEDVQLVRTLELPAYGLTYERYQQRFGPAQARVYGGQLTLLRDGTGRVTSVVGAHYAGISPANSVNVNAAAARERAGRDVPSPRERSVELMIDPANGRYFYWVESRSFAERRVHWIDAGNGGVLKDYDAVADNHGTGVNGDTKSLTGLTTFHGASGHGATGAHYDLISTDGRQTTYDARNGTFFLYNVTDSDDHWTTAGRTSPGQPALVDAQFHANVTDDYLQARHGLNWLSCYPGGMKSVAHYSLAYNNAFWDGTYTVYGDGDGLFFRELSGGLDVVAHEHTHGVTDCTSSLVYQGESGALNEAFSDMLGSSAEFYANDAPDWLVGEEIQVAADTEPGFRNMADPQEDGDPDHYSERYTGPDDNGGVHSNSAIPNHAYFLLVNGGRNRGCAGSASGHTHSANCDTTVPAIGVAAAERIFYLGFTALTQNATMCNARSSTIANAGAHAAATDAAWTAVGVTATLCGGGGGGGGGANTAPTADAKSATVRPGRSVTINLTGSDAQSCDLTFAIASSPGKGTLSGISNASCTAGSPNRDSATVVYTPNGGVRDTTDSFSYTVTDGAGATSSPATVSVTIRKR